MGLLFSYKDSRYASVQIAFHVVDGFTSAARITTTLPSDGEFSDADRVEEVPQDVVLMVDPIYPWYFATTSL